MIARFIDAGLLDKIIQNKAAWLEETSILIKGPHLPWIFAQAVALHVASHTVPRIINLQEQLLLLQEDTEAVERPVPWAGLRLQFFWSNSRF